MISLTLFVTLTSTQAQAPIVMTKTAILLQFECIIPKKNDVSLDLVGGDSGSPVGLRSSGWYELAGFDLRIPSAVPFREAPGDPGITPGWRDTHSIPGGAGGSRTRKEMSLKSRGTLASHQAGATPTLYQEGRGGATPGRRCL